MLGRIRGRPKDDDEALEALRRRTAARLAAIVGISADEPPEDDIGPDAVAAGPAPDDDATGPEDAAASALVVVHEAGPEDAVDAPVTGAEFEATAEVEAAAPADATAEVRPAVAERDPSAPEEGARDADPVAAESVPDERATTERTARSARRPSVGSRRRAAPAVALPEHVVPVMAPPSVERRDAPAKAAAKVAPAKPAAAKAATAKPTARRRKASTLLPAACPSCGTLLEELPTASRRCGACRQRIVVRRVEGRLVLVAEAVAPFFDDHRRRLLGGERIKREAGRWLQMAALAGAAPEVLEARARSVAARPTPEALTSARALYATTVERSCRAARKARDWRSVAELRFRQARAYHRAAGSAAPADPTIAALHAEAIDASLRRIREVSADAELVGGTCCDACREAGGRIVRIAAERRAPTVPHPDCPAGLCGCRWDVPVKARPAAKPAARRRAAAVAGAGRPRG